MRDEPFRQAGLVAPIDDGPSRVAKNVRWSLGVAASVILVDVVRRLGTRVLPRIEDVSIDWRVAVFAVAAIVITGLAGGLAQVFATRRDPSVITAGTSARVSSPKASTSLVVVLSLAATIVTTTVNIVSFVFFTLIPFFRHGRKLHAGVASDLALADKSRTSMDLAKRSSADLVAEKQDKPAAPAAAEDVKEAPPPSYA